MKFILFIFFLISSIAFTSASVIYKDISLNPQEHYMNGDGKFTLRYSTLESGKSASILSLKLKDLPVDKNKVYVAWLVDEDSNYYLSLGKLDLSHGGRINEIIKKNNFNLFTFDKLLITQEPASDFDSNPSQHVFSADLPFRSESSILMRAKLNGQNEVPRVRTSAKGDAEIMVDTTRNILSFEINHERLSNEVSAHIHGFAFPGQNAPVLFELPLGVTKIGSWNYPQEIEERILEGQTYINIHSSNFPNGEIRGQIVVK